MLMSEPLPKQDYLKRNSKGFGAFYGNKEFQSENDCIGTYATEDLAWEVVCLFHRYTDNIDPQSQLDPLP
jgi:hypothetical protein